ncbi:MAG: RNA polymerase subunit sigma-24 [Archangiaceae bacterium]|nr:RNA polymerase subunit sigma-24 [Archangiaceae bacterium]
MWARVFRRESGRVLAGLIRELGDFDAAEDVLQDTLARAVEVWTPNGAPENPGAWLTTVAKNRARDLLRRGARVIETRDEPAPDVAAPEPAPGIDPDHHTSGVVDDRLRLIFTCCHPALARPAQVALTLRTLGGLTTFEIARAFLESEPTTAQRLVRAKKKIREAGIGYQVPSRDRLPARLESVLAVLYLIFNEGYSAAAGDLLIRRELCEEAIRLTRELSELLPDPEVLGLLALMMLHHARRDARTSADGEFVPLELQDRSTWNRAEIDQGAAVLDRALTANRRGPYQVQAAIAALHGTAARAEATDWAQIELLYRTLRELTPGPMVDLNHAVAVAMSQGLDAGLERMATLDAELGDYYLLPAARADLYRRLGRRAEAAAQYRRALELVSNARERRYLERRLASLQ